MINWAVLYTREGSKDSGRILAILILRRVGARGGVGGGRNGRGKRGGGGTHQFYTAYLSYYVSLRESAPEAM